MGRNGECGEGWGEDRCYWGAFASRRDWESWRAGLPTGTLPSPEVWQGAHGSGVGFIPLLSSSCFPVVKVCHLGAVSPHLQIPSSVPLLTVGSQVPSPPAWHRLPVWNWRDVLVWMEVSRRICPPCPFIWKRTLFGKRVSTDLKRRSFWVREGPSLQG